MRNLTIQGRILILKTLAFAKVVYLVSAICTSTWAIKEINKLFFQFVWKNKRDKIARKIIINDIDKGGMNMIDFKSFCTAAKAVWVQCLYYSQEDIWSYIPKTSLKHVNRYR